MPASLATKLNLNDELKIKTLSNSYFFKSWANFNAPKNPSCFSFLLF